MGRRFILFMLTFALIAAAASLKAEQFRYESHGKRDPFVPLIGQDRSIGAMPLSEIVSVDDVILEGIAAQTTGPRTAILNGELVKENFKSGDVEVKKITKNSVLITIGGKEYTIYLHEEGGRKGG